MNNKYVCICSVLERTSKKLKRKRNRKETWTILHEAYNNNRYIKILKNNLTQNQLHWWRCSGGGWKWSKKSKGNGQSHPIFQRLLFINFSSPTVFSSLFHFYLLNIHTYMNTNTTQPWCHQDDDHEDDGDAYNNNEQESLVV